MYVYAYVHILHVKKNSIQIQVHKFLDEFFGFVSVATAQALDRFISYNNQWRKKDMRYEK